MSGDEDFWTDETSVLLTSYWGWTPETWGAVGWSLDRGRTRRDNLLKELSDPFITVVYVTKNKSDVDHALKGMVAGFYLMSHEIGDRDEFTHPVHFDRNPEKWRHSLRATRAFSYLPEYRPRAKEIFPDIQSRVLAVAAWGEVIENRATIDRLKSTPWVEVPVFSSQTNTDVSIDVDFNSKGMVPPGPDNAGGYTVPKRTMDLPRDLYVLRLSGDTDAYLGKSAEGRTIFKIGLSASPDLRRQSFQKSMPRGAFQWIVERTTQNDGHSRVQRSQGG